MSADSPSFRVLMVCTREIPAEPKSGREKTLAFIATSLKSGGEVRILRLKSFLENRSPSRIAYAVLQIARQFLRPKEPLPLQCILFSEPEIRKRLRAAIDEFEPSTIYFDGVRSGIHAEYVRACFPRLRVVCDFDDLMSRRLQLLGASHEAMSLGYLKRFLPKWVQDGLLEGWLGRRVLEHERRSLTAVENRIAAACDSVVLVSSVDAAELSKTQPAQRITVIPPGMPAVAMPALTQPLRIQRFVFIGSDELVQNRQSIDFLVSLWERTRPATPLYIYGKQTRSYSAHAGVHFQGFIADVAEAYESGSVLLAPSFLGGGVKTKVLEAMAYGVVPIGTASTFEGIDAKTDGLVFSTEKLESLVADPQLWESHLDSERSHVLVSAAQAHNATTLSRKWRHVIWPW